MSSSEEITEIITPVAKRKTRKRKQKKQVHNDSVQIVEEISKTTTHNSTIDTSIEILSEHVVKSTNSKNSVESIESSESTNAITPIKEMDDVNNLAHKSKPTAEKAPDFISLSSQVSTMQSQSSTSVESSFQDLEEAEFNDLFQIDRAPCSDSEKYTHVPKYVSKFSESALSEEKVVAKKSWRQAALCFNCGGEHSMRDCTKARNQGNINRNRNIFMANKAKQTGNVSASRYHLDHHQRFSHIKPGVISKRLRRALKLSVDQLPLHVYRMRLVGYPPAWLEEAKVKHSGIAVFDSSGQALADPEDEDGEVEMDRCKYDMKKLIEYPGFNTRPPKGTLNESDYLGFPDMLPDQNKERMISYLAPRAAMPYKKRKLDSKDLPQRDNEDLNHTADSIRRSTDMEVDDVPETRFEAPGNCAFIPSLPDEPQPPRPPAPPSPTPPPPGVEEDEEEGEIKEEEEGKGAKRKVPEEEVAGSSKKRKSDVPEFVEPSVPSIFGNKSTLSKSPSTPSLGSIKLLDLGTPIIKHAVSAEKLPSHDAFSKNICDVINFDNLPDSTGKYKVLSKVVKRVRTLMSKITGKHS